jgi:hypothetical protein
MIVVSVLDTRMETLGLGKLIPTRLLDLLKKQIIEASRFSLYLIIKDISFPWLVHPTLFSNFIVSPNTKLPTYAVSKLKLKNDSICGDSGPATQNTQVTYVSQASCPTPTTCCPHSLRR